MMSMMDDGLGSSGFQGIDWKNARGIQWADSQNVGAYFYVRPIHNPAKSAETGAPWFDDKVFVKIHPPGERLNIIDRPATVADQRRWPREWSLFQQNKVQIPEGHPVSLIFPDKPSIAETLKANGVFTLEQLASLSGEAIQTVGMGCQAWVNEAQKYLEQANKGASITQVRRELEERDQQIYTLNHKIELMSKEIERLRTSAPAAGATGGFTPEQLQTIISMMGGQRPVFPPPLPNEPGQPAHTPPAAYDAATAQINAVHPTREIAEAAAKSRPRKAPATPATPATSEG